SRGEQPYPNLPPAARSAVNATDLPSGESAGNSSIPTKSVSLLTPTGRRFSVGTIIRDATNPAAAASTTATATMSDDNLRLALPTDIGTAGPLSSRESISRLNARSRAD